MKDFLFALLVTGLLVLAFYLGNMCAVQDFKIEAALQGKAEFFDDPCGHTRWRWLP